MADRPGILDYEMTIPNCEPCPVEQRMIALEIRIRELLESSQTAMKADTERQFEQLHASSRGVSAFMRSSGSDIARCMTENARLLERVTTALGVFGDGATEMRALLVPLIEILGGQAKAGAARAVVEVTAARDAEIEREKTRRADAKHLVNLAIKTLPYIALAITALWAYYLQSKGIRIK